MPGSDRPFKMLIPISLIRATDSALSLSYSLSLTSTIRSAIAQSSSRQGFVHHDQLIN